MTPQQRFQDDPVKRDTLREILANPVMQEALALLKDEIEPGREGVPEANPTIAAAKFHQVGGANHMIRGLGRLTQAYVIPPTLKPVRQLLKEEE